MSRVSGLDHVAVAVKDLEQSLPFYTEVLGLKLLGVETLPEHGVRAAFLEAGGVRIELMEPLDPDGYLARHIRKHGQGLAHLCFATQGLDDLVGDLRQRELFLLSHEPCRGAGGRRVIFLHPKDNAGVLTEFAED